MSQYLTLLLNVFRYHKKKILFFLVSIVFGFLVLFPYDDLSDFITLKVTQATQSNVYLQFDGLSFGFMPQVGIKMDNVLIETVYGPTLAVKTLGFAPKIKSIFGIAAGKVKAYGLFGGDATVYLDSSNELDIDTQEFEVSIDLENVDLKELSKLLKSSYNFPLTMNGETHLDSTLYVDPLFKKQPKGNIKLNVKNLDIPSSNIPIKMGMATMSISLPALKLTELVLVGNINDGKLFIKDGKIGEAKNELYGQITGDIFFEIKPGGKLSIGGYDLKINLNVSESLKNQLSFALDIIDGYQGIKEKYKFDSLRGVRYSMRLTARNMNTPPRVTSY